MVQSIALEYIVGTGVYNVDVHKKCSTRNQQYIFSVQPLVYTPYSLDEKLKTIIKTLFKNCGFMAETVHCLCYY